MNAFRDSTTRKGDPRMTAQVPEAARQLVAVLADAFCARLRARNAERKALEDRESRPIRPSGADPLTPGGPRAADVRAGA